MSFKFQLNWLNNDEMAAVLPRKKHYVFWRYAAAFLMKLFFFCSDTL